MYLKICEITEKYRGLYRSFPFVIWNNKAYGELYFKANEYINNADECGCYDFSAEKALELKKLSDEINAVIPADLIVFGGACDLNNAKFLGFDVTGGGRYLSLIKELSIDRKDMIYRYFNGRLNEYSLFDNEDDAKMLVNLYCDLKKYGVNVENVYDPHPTKIYLY